MNAFDIPEPYCLLEEANAVIIPVPFEATVCYGQGTCRGPQAILDASCQVEFYDEFLSREPYRIGIAAIDPLELEKLPPEAALDCIRDTVAEQHDAGRFAACLGGEHTLTAAAAAVHLVSDKQADEISVVSFDAHADLRHSYQGTIYSHACVMRRLVEIGFNIVLVGTRSRSIEEVRFIEEQNITMFSAESICKGTVTPADIAGALTPKVYLSIDCDVLDPGIMPAVGTPEPGGLTWYQMTDILAAVTRNSTVLGMDLVELAPIPGFTAPDFLVAKLLYRVLGMVGDGIKQ